MDETLFTYVVTAKYMFSGVDIYLEMLGGIQANGMLPAAEIETAESKGLVFEGCFATEESLYEIWLYRIANQFEN